MPSQHRIPIALPVHELQALHGDLWLIDRLTAPVEGYLDSRPEMVDRVQSPVEGQVAANSAALNQGARARRITAPDRRVYPDAREIRHAKDDEQRGTGQGGTAEASAEPRAA